MPEFVIIMNKIYDDFNIFKINPDDDIVYFRMKDNLSKLDYLINNNQVASNVYLEVLKFYTIVYRYTSYKRPYGDKKSKKNN